MRIRSGPGTPSCANSCIRFFMAAQYFSWLGLNLRLTFTLLVDELLPEGSSPVFTASKRACR